MGFKKTDECLAKVGDDEPIFVLRAHDITADEFVEAWAKRHVRRLGAKHPKIVEARQLAMLMRAWPNRKFPD